MRPTRRAIPAIKTALPCGVGGNFGPGITDGLWIDPTDGGRITLTNPPRAGLPPDGPVPPGITCTRGSNSV